MKLMFHDEEKFLRYALEQEEPKQSLESMLNKHDEVVEKLKLFREARAQEEDKWRTTIINNEGAEEAIIDYELWKATDPDSYTRFACSEHTALEFLDWIEEQIDIKICYLNKQTQDVNLNVTLR